MKIKILIEASLIIIIALTGCRDILFGDKFRTEEEIISIFKDNKDVFVDIVNDLSESKFHWSIDTDSSDRSARPDWKYADLNNGIQLVVLEKENFDELPSIYIKAKKNRSINSVIIEHKFKIITSDHYMDTDCIYFVKQTSIGYDAGIMYCPGGITEDPYITKMVPIEDSWYYYEAK